jgi:hypothetical protein
MTLTSEIRIKLFSEKQVGQHPGIKLKTFNNTFDNFIPKRVGQHHRNGGST